MKVWFDSFQKALENDGPLNRRILATASISNYACIVSLRSLMTKAGSPSIGLHIPLFKNP